MSAIPVTRFVVVNGVPHTAIPVPPVSSFLESTPGAYTTTRTHAGASLLLFWDRHLRRLADSVRILADSRPDLLGSRHPLSKPLFSLSLLHDSLRLGSDLALRSRVRRAGCHDELAVTALVRASESDKEELDVYVHLGFYSPPLFGIDGARLAVAGRGREAATAKYSDWARVRKRMEKVRPPLVTELLLSNDGDRILEGSVTNFFVVCHKVVNGTTDESGFGSESIYSVEVQTAPLSDGVLPGVVRQLVIEACSSCGIPLREVAPSWSERELWEEAFVTSSLKLMQHVETIQAPISRENMHLKTWEEVSWVVKRFEGAGPISTQIQTEIMTKVGVEGYQLSNLF